MKQVLLFSLFITFSIGAMSQSREFSQAPWGFWLEFDLGYIGSDNTPKEATVLKENNVKSRERIRYHKGIPIKTIEHFDTEGRWTLIEHFTHKGEMTKTTYLYGETGNIKEKKHINTKGQIETTNYTYDNEGRITAKEMIDAKGNYSGAKTMYGENKKILNRKIFKKDRENPVKELNYEYYENGDIKSSNYYEKGKLKYTWKYDCKPEGELIDVKRKDETMLCISEDVDANGNRIVWERKFDEKGKLTKIKTVYFSDSLILSKQRFNGADKLVYEMNYQYNKEKTRATGNTVNLFHKDGTPYLASETTYSKKIGAKSVYYTKKGKVDYTAEYLYNDVKMPLKSQRIDGRWSHTYLYHYTATNLKKIEIRIHKNNTYINEYVYDYFVE